MRRGLPPITADGIVWGLTAVVVAALVAWGVRRLVRHTLLWQGRSESSSRVFGRLAGWLVVTLGIGAGLTIAFPSVRPVDLLGGVGVVSIAAGIAFQTVLGNMFAGIVILMRDSYRVGDQIAVDEHRGTITALNLTSSTLRTFDGRKVIVPNVVLHSNVVTVQTGFEMVRTQVDIDVDDSADLTQAKAVAEAAMLVTPGVLTEPRPQALLSEVGVATVRLQLRFWSGAQQLETRAARDAVISSVLAAFAEHGIPSGSDVVMIDATPDLRRALRER